MKEYALYKGEKCLAIGTMKEIAKIINVQVKTIRFYNTKTYRKRCENSKNRRELVKLDV